MLPKIKLPVLLILSSMLMTSIILPAAAEDKPSKNFFIEFYQSHISAADGGRCPMTPSCSEYADRAIKKHGLALGWIMACDRLVRCGRDEADISSRIRIKNNEYVFDPVSHNDFWWFDNTKTTDTPAQ